MSEQGDFGQSQRYCGYCGTQLKAGSKYCPSCEESSTPETRGLGEASAESTSDSKSSDRYWSVTLEKVVGPAIGLGALLIYLSTLTPTIATRDAARFQIAAPLLGTGHPTGYPTFILLGKLFTYIPVGDIAYRVNLMAAFFGAVAASLLFLVAKEIGGRILPAAGAALLFAVSSTFWSQATQAEVYTLHAAFILSVLYLLLLWRKGGRYSRRYLLGAALIYGISLGNNMGMVLMAPAYSILLVYGCFRSLFPKLLAGSAGLFFLGLSVYFYIPIRGFSGAWHNYREPARNWEEVWRLVSGARLHGRMGTSPTELVEQAGYFLRELSLQAVHPAGYALAVLMLGGGAYGAWRLLHRNQAVGIALFLGLICTLAYALSYQIADIRVYFIPVYLLLFIFTAVAAGDIAARIPPPYRALLLAAPLIAAGFVLAVNYPSHDMSGDYAQRRWAERVFATLPENAIVYGKARMLPLTYLQEVEGGRKDVKLRWLGSPTMREYLASDIKSGRPVYFVRDQHYTGRYLEEARPYATPKREGSLIRLLPK